MVLPLVHGYHSENWKACWGKTHASTFADSIGWPHSLYSWVSPKNAYKWAKLMTALWCIGKPCPICHGQVVFSPRWWQSGGNKGSVSPNMGFSDGLAVKNPPANAGDVRDSGLIPMLSKRLGFNPWVGKIPWRRKWKPSSILTRIVPRTEEPDGQ